FINETTERIRPAVPGRTDRPIANIHRQSAGGAGLGCDRDTIAVELPRGAIISARQMDPTAAAQIAARNRERSAVSISASAIQSCDRANHIVATFNLEK